NYGMAKVFSLAQRIPLSAILHYSDQFMMILDKDLRILQINDSFLKFLSKSRVEVVGKNLSFIPLAEVPLQDLIHALVEAIEGKKSLEDILIQNREEHFFKARILEIQFEDGSEGYTVILIDLTEQKRAERALQMSEARYRAVVEGQTELICRYLPNGTHVFVNEAYCRSFNVKREEIIGKKFKPPIPEEDRERLRFHMKSLTPEHPVGTIDHRVVQPDGSIHWQQWTDRAIFNESGELVEYQSVGRDITERKETEVALRHSEEKYRELVEHAGTVILKMDLSGNITLFNEYAEDFFGFPREEVIGRSVVGTIVPVTESSGRDMRELIKGICTDTEHYKLHENENITRDGRRVWLRWTNRMICDQSGNPSGVLSIGIDITEQKQMEEQLKASEKRFRELAEMLPLPVFETDANLMLTYGNEQAFRSFGYTPEETRRDISILEMVAPEDRDRARKNLERILGEAQRTKEQYTGLRRDGSRFPLVEHSAPIIEAGRIVGMRGVVIDLTDHNLARQALQRERDFIAAVLDTVDALVVVLDSEGRIAGFNRACECMTGYKQDEVTGKLFYDLFLVPEEVESVRRTFQVLVREKEHIHARNYWLMRDGTRRIIDWSSTVLQDADGQVTHVIGTGIDITERKEMEDELRRFRSSQRVPESTAP
ncbi:MAG TPA: PAS domain S-box protein, partial [Methanomicrobiales archaeon]|nr:PAS domain S-box protein [Methanomicrobiales archaeon]